MILNKELKETRRAKEDKNVKNKDDPQGSNSKCVLRPFFLKWVTVSMSERATTTNR